MKNNNDNLVKIAVNKSLLKEFYINSQRTVYMNDGSEFQIQIFNPYTYSIGALISINGTEMPNKLVIKPGQRVWLERYLNEARKFLFETYEVNGDSYEVKKAINNNGLIEVKFYKEIQNNISYVYNPNIINYLESPWVYTITTAEYPYVNTLSSSINTNYNYSATVKPSSKKIETGRIEKGDHSNQKFNTVYNDFEYWAFKTESIHILPQSVKPIYANDLKKVYCSNCGRKLNQKFKYCPYCGAKCVF